MNKQSSPSLQGRHIAANLAEYRETASAMHWITPRQARDAEARRAGIISALASEISWANKQTKPYYGSLSPGCQICGQGLWTCLFINGKCNCRCFYCPSEQNDIGVPTTNRIPFSKADHYAGYIQHFGFKGASISGGEPLLTFERTVDFIETLRRKLGADLHIWLYTNGTLATPQRLQRLQRAGLNEIRFDISAVDYDLSKVRMAAGLIPWVTVEIPAIPEDLERLTLMLPQLTAAGVNFLNLHQLRLTPHNQSRLTQRAYTFLHGDKVTVLESELAALRLLSEARRAGLQLPINYCSYVYKHRYQQAAARRRSAAAILKPHESITEKGYIRTLTLASEPADLDPQARHLAQVGTTPGLWWRNAKGDQLAFHESLWSQLDFSKSQLLVKYSEALFSAHVSYRHEFKEIHLGSQRSMFIEKYPIGPECELDVAQQEQFKNHVLDSGTSQPVQDEKLKDMLSDYEFIGPGLQDYY